jgi:hypothetical protein
MTGLYAARRLLCTLAVTLAAAVLLAWPPRTVRAGQEAQSPPPGQQEQNQKTSQQAKPEKKGGFFDGMKPVTGSSSAQTSYTASAGAKGVGEGKKIGEVAPTAADRQAVTEMERYFIPPQEVKKFDQDGNLKP